MIVANTICFDRRCACEQQVDIQTRFPKNNQLIILALPASHPLNRLGAFYSKFEALSIPKQKLISRSSFRKHDSVYHVYESRLLQHRRLHQEINVRRKLPPTSSKTEK
jgi:hypothetical protein